MAQASWRDGEVSASPAPSAPAPRPQEAQAARTGNLCGDFCGAEALSRNAQLPKAASFSGLEMFQSSLLAARMRIVTDQPRAPFSAAELTV